MSDLRIKTCVLGQVSTNCYLVYNEQSKQAVVIDPADNSSYINEMCGKLGITLEAILLTHGHFDHILAAGELAAEHQLKIYAGAGEQALLLDPASNLSGGWGSPALSIKADVLADDNAVLDLIGWQWRVIHTPGHTAGSVCYYIEAEGVLFSGDTLFEESLGRTDLPTGDGSTIVTSILKRLLVLPDDTMVYPGHGNPTVIAHEKQYNPVAVYYRETL